MLTLNHVGLDIYQYLDSRMLLKDYFEACREQNSRYSNRFFAKHLGYAAPNYVKLIVDGVRNISDKHLDAFSEMLGLTGSEREYFEWLVRMTQAQDHERKNHYFQQLSALRRKKLSVHLVEEAKFESLSSWLHLVIREMTFLDGFQANVNWINKRLSAKVSPSDISRCLKDLENAGLLEVKDGELKAVNSSITFPDEVRSLMIQNFHRGILDQGKVALQQPLSDREYGATLVATTREKYECAKEKMKRFRAEMLELLDTEDGQAEEVVVLAFQLFHVAQPDKKSD